MWCRGKAHVVQNEGQVSSSSPWASVSLWGDMVGGRVRKSARVPVLGWVFSHVGPIWMGSQWSAGPVVGESVAGCVTPRPGQGGDAP